MAEKYKQIDEAIILKISVAKANAFNLIAGGELLRMADTLAASTRHGERDGWRVIDRRLQALRKAGKVAYARKTGWTAP